MVHEWIFAIGLSTRILAPPIFRELYVTHVDRDHWRPWHPEQHLMTHYGIYEAVEAMGVRGN